LVKLVLFEHDRGAKIRAMAAGLRDGLRSVTGRRRSFGDDEAR
jgi:hypothetical protein